MKDTVSQIVDKMLVFNFLGKEKLLKQFQQAQVKVDEEEQHYLVSFSGLADVNKIMIRKAQIRMDSFPTMQQTFTFELNIEKGFIQTLKISKHDEKKEVAFVLDEICFEKIAYSYDYALFKNMEYLPIGTVVSLQKGIKKLMIYGRKVKNEEDHKHYAYVGCFYPEGIRDFNRLFLFNPDMITKVHWQGMEGIEEDKVCSMMDERVYHE